MNVMEIDELITYHKDSLADHRQHMGPLGIHYEEQTVKALEELRRIKEEE